MEVKLDVIELGAQAAVTDRIRRDMEWEEIHEPRYRATFINTYMRFAGQRFEELSYPATWWDAVKARFIPMKLRRWFPVKITKWSPVVVYPLIALPNEPRWEVMEVHDRQTT